MKRANFLITMLALAALSLIACSSDDKLGGSSDASGVDAAAGAGKPDTGTTTPDTGPVTPDTGTTDTGTTDTGTADTGTADTGETDTGPTDTGAPDTGPPPAEKIDVSADITGDTTWKGQNTYTLKKHIFVKGGALTIEAGAVILGDKGSSLVVTQNGRINAQGTKDKPIVFTSSQPAGKRAPGDWGGVVLLGKAPINITGGSNKVEGFPVTENETVYGGTDAAHDCGTIQYARIEFAGFELAKDNELNGLTAAGCGSKTNIDYVQVHLGQDDGVEMFGGTANLKHIVITQPDDDGLDWDFGWTGKVQFLVIQQNKLVGNYGFESDNNAQNNDAAPRSMPVIWNATLVGSDAEPGKAGKEQGGMLLRRGTAGRFENFIITHFADFPINIADESTTKQCDGTNLVLKNSILNDNGNTNNWPADKKDDDKGFDEGAYFKKAEFKNRFEDPMLTDAKNLTAPDFTPKAGGPAFTGGGTPPADGFFDDKATFVGAMGADDWTKGWTAYPEN
ncbi:MAG: hypothetical protein GMKNLPBB_00757 [Myxococcota bacterium]|nr:hypothetical protein [Myxococcota bacterium]